MIKPGTPNKRKTANLRFSVVLIVSVVWAVTALGFIVCAIVRPTIGATIQVNVSELSLKTDSSHILDSIYSNQITIANIDTLDLQNIGTGMRIVDTAGSAQQFQSSKLFGDQLSQCAFYNVLSSGFDLTSPTLISLSWNPEEASRALTARFGIPINISMTAQSGNSGLTCTRIHDSESGSRTVNIVFDAGGGTQISVKTRENSSFHIVGLAANSIGGNIAIEEPLQMFRVNRGTGEGISTIRPGAEGHPNQVTFTTNVKPLDVAPGELLSIYPDNKMYATSISIAQGIQIKLEGPVSKIESGPGLDTMKNVTPTLLQRLIGLKGVLGLIPSVVALILGILERMKLLPRHE